MESSKNATARAKRLAMIRAAAEPATAAPPAAPRPRPRPTGKRRGSTPTVLPPYDGPHRALPNWNYAVLRGGH